MSLWEKIHLFGVEVGNKSFLKKIRYLEQEQEKVERYLATIPKDREFKGRVADRAGETDDNTG